MSKNLLHLCLNYSNILYKNLYKRFLKRTYKSYQMTTFSAVVVEVRGHYKSANNQDYCQMVIVDGILE